MAITFPRAFPASVKIQSSKFELRRYVASGNTSAGGVITTELADPQWLMEITTEPLNGDKASEFKAWWASLRGGGKSFLASDPKRLQPIAYPGGVTALTRAGGGAFDGTAKLAAVNVGGSAYSITVGAASGYLPASFELMSGDLIGLVSTGSPTHYSLHRVLEDATADGGGVVTLNLDPFVYSSVFTVGATVNVVNPLAEFVPKPDSWDFQDGGDPSPASISAVSKVF